MLFLYYHLCTQNQGGLSRGGKFDFMWIKYNANPKRNRVGDCTVRAISKLIGSDWHVTFSGLCLQGYIDCDMPSSNNVWQKYLKEKGYKRHALPDACPECYSVSDFCKEHNVGRYLLGLDSHVVCAIDGDYYDTWDCGDETVIYYFTKDEVKNSNE